MTPAIATIGTFDGVHTGHTFLLNFLSDKAHKYNLRPIVVTFANHPLSIINPDNAPKLLTSPELKKQLIQNCGINDVISLTFNDQLRSLTALSFARKYLVPQNVEILVTGFNNTFGSDRLNFSQLADKLSKIGIQVISAPPCPDTKVSSTQIRKLISNAQIEQANTLLGYPYTIQGIVEHGNHIGTSLGFPTANIQTDPAILLPPNGVYTATTLDKPTMVNIGTAPTVRNNGTKTVEAHIIGLDHDLYGQKLTLQLHHRLRPERKFDNIDQLRNQLATDLRTTLSLHPVEQGSHPATILPPM